MRAALAAYAGRCPAASCRSRSLRPFLGEPVDLSVRRKDDVGAVADEEAPANQDTGVLEVGDLAEQALGIDDHPVAEHADHLLAQRARRDLVEEIVRPSLRTVCPALGPPFCQRATMSKPSASRSTILPSAFVAPLAADDCEAVHANTGAPARARACTASIAAPLMTTILIDG